jgi:hypothetical protein
MGQSVRQYHVNFEGVRNLSHRQRRQLCHFGVSQKVPFVVGDEFTMLLDPQLKNRFWFHCNFSGPGKNR